MRLLPEAEVFGAGGKSAHAASSEGVASNLEPAPPPPLPLIPSAGGVAAPPGVIGVRWASETAARARVTSGMSSVTGGRVAGSGVSARLTTSPTAAATTRVVLASAVRLPLRFCRTTK